MTCLQPFPAVSTLAVCALLGACTDGTPFVPPPLSPLGQDLSVTRTAIPTAIPLTLSGETSLFGRSSRDLLTDVRAANVGDVLTVIIELNDRAEFDNESERSRQSDTKVKFGGALSGRGFDGPSNSAETEGDLNIGSTSRYRGSGGIDRSENVSLKVAAIVTEVLANGNLIISGTQEIRVNAEMRVLKLAGIVNPLDVSRANTVGYDKIAEARISYGGRGRSTEVQQPRWGQQLFDKVVPF